MLFLQVNVLADGWVCLEFTKPHDGGERVVEIFRVSPDGGQIEVYQPEGGRGSTLRGCPPSPPSPHTVVKQFSYDDLPRKYWKKYEYAARYADDLVYYVCRVVILMVFQQP